MENKMRKNSRIGGQAVLEGVMMRSPERMAVAVRTPSGIALDTKDLVKPGKKAWYRKTPLIRGVVSFVDMLITGIESLNTSASLMGIEEEPGKFEKWISKKTGKSAMDIATGFALIIGLALAVGLFFILPQFISGLLTHLVNNAFLMNLIEGGLRLFIFVGYLWVVSLAPDIKRFFAYHGAEHKVVNCYENGELLTPENAQKFTTRHPRCGTSFLLVVMVISVLVFALTGWGGSGITRILLRLALLPVIAAISFETLMLLARWNNWFVRALRAPGMALQAMTTREPDDSMIEVAIAAFAACLDEEERKTCMPEIAVEIVEPAEEARPGLCEAIGDRDSEPSQPEAAEHDENSAAQ
jgi:uncharacterized protein YqhQ